jgi:DNA-binding transcriptional LysR family regulator
MRAPRCTLERHYETDMAEGLKMMALEGRGVAFLPESAVTRTQNKQLARADDGGAQWEIEMEIRLYRERPSASRRGKAIVERLWELPRTAAEKQWPQTPRGGVER